MITHNILKTLLGFILIYIVGTSVYILLHDNSFAHLDAKNLQHMCVNEGLAFEDFPATNNYTEHKTLPNFVSRPEALRFETAISQSASEGVNFAADYTIATWGCGTSCQSSAIINLGTGNIIAYGISSTEGLSFQTNSRLLVINPPENAPPISTELPEYLQQTKTTYYVLENDTLKEACVRPFLQPEKHITQY